MSRPVRSPEIHELRAFCAAYDLGSLGKAARLLNVSQPALSKRIKTLEGLVGTTLLERTPAGVVPTEAGRQLYAEARKLLAQSEVIERLVEGLHGQEPPIRLAISPTIYEQLLPRLLADYEGAEGLKLEITAVNSKTAREMVAQGRADLAIAALDPDGQGLEHLQAYELCEDEIVVGVPTVHNWSNYEEIPLDLFLKTPMIMRDPEASSRRLVEHELADRGLGLAPPLLEVGSAHVLKAAAKRRNQPAILPKMSLTGEKGDLLPRRVEGLPLKRAFAVLVASPEALRPKARDFLEYLIGS